MPMWLNSTGGLFVCFVCLQVPWDTCISPTRPIMPLYKTVSSWGNDTWSSMYTLVMILIGCHTCTNRKPTTHIWLCYFQHKVDPRPSRCTACCVKEASSESLADIHPPTLLVLLTETTSILCNAELETAAGNCNKGLTHRSSARQVNFVLLDPAIWPEQ